MNGPRRFAPTTDQVAPEQVSSLDRNGCPVSPECAAKLVGSTRFHQRRVYTPSSPQGRYCSASPVLRGHAGLSGRRGERTRSPQTGTRSDRLSRRWIPVRRPRCVRRLGRGRIHRNTPCVSPKRTVRVTPIVTPTAKSIAHTYINQ